MKEPETGVAEKNDSTWPNSGSLNRAYVRSPFLDDQSMRRRILRWVSPRAELAMEL